MPRAIFRWPVLATGAVILAAAGLAMGIAGGADELAPWLAVVAGVGVAVSFLAGRRASGRWSWQVLAVLFAVLMLVEAVPLVSDREVVRGGFLPRVRASGLVLFGKAMGQVQSFME